MCAEWCVVWCSWTYDASRVTNSLFGDIALLALRSVWTNVWMRVWIINFFSSYLVFSSFWIINFFSSYLVFSSFSGTPLVATKSWYLYKKCKPYTDTTLLSFVSLNLMHQEEHVPERKGITLACIFEFFSNPKRKTSSVWLIASFLLNANI